MRGKMDSPLRDIIMTARSCTFAEQSVPVETGHVVRVVFVCLDGTIRPRRDGISLPALDRRLCVEQSIPVGMGLFQFVFCCPAHRTIRPRRDGTQAQSRPDQSQKEQSTQYGRGRRLHCLTLPIRWKSQFDLFRSCYTHAAASLLNVITPSVWHMF